MDQDMGFIKVLGGLKSEPTEIKMDPDPVEIGIDDILDSSDEEIDTKDEQIKPLQENKETISKDIENFSPNNSEKENETETEADPNASKNLISDEIFVLNFGKIPAKPKEADSSEAEKSNRTTDVSKELKELIVIQPPQGSYMCHLCQLKFKQKRELSDHMKFHLHAEQMIDDMHTCNICEKTYTRKDNLERHRKQVHNADKIKNIRWQKCHLCQLKFKQKRELSDHMKCHLKAKQMLEDMHTCNICEKTYTRKDNLERHKKQTHNKDNIQRQNSCEQMLDDKHTCNICENGFTHKANLERHKKQVHNKDETQTEADSNASKNLQSDEIFVLDIGKMPAKPKEVDLSEACNSDSTTDVTKDLKEVIVTQPPEVSTIIEPPKYTRLAKGKFVCNYCQHTTNDIRRLRKHIRQMHRTVTNIVTQPPEGSFIIEPHKYTRLSKRIFVCYYCQHTTGTSKMLDRHIRQMHRTATKISQCPYCPFKSKWSLRSHILFKHKDGIEIHWFKCRQCQLKFKQKQQLSDHMNCHLDAKQHTCNICEKAYTRKDNLERHTKQFHNKDNIQRCDLRKLRIKQKRGFSDHIKCHLNAKQVLDEKHTCNICGKSFRRKAKLNRHKKQVHNTDETQAEADSNSSKNLQAYNSNRTTDVSKELKEVIVIQPPNGPTIVTPDEYTKLANGKFVCNHCQRTISKIHHHIRLKHRTVTAMQQCPYCPFKSKWALRSHILYKHKKDNEIQWFKCHLCPLKFKQKRGLFDHIQCHLGAREHTCNICKKAFKRKDQLQRHTKLVHNKDKLKKIQCQECDYVTKNPGSLTYHFQIHHTDFKAQPIYQCKECEYKTRSKTCFSIHKAKHKTELVCESCGYKVNTIDRLKIHLLTHKKELSEKDLKYKCDLCDYKTYRPYSLKVHKLNHLKPEEIQYFYCYHCDFKAKRKDNLKAHVLRHFKKEEVKLQCYLCEFSSKNRSLLTNHINKEHPKVTP